MRSIIGSVVLILGVTACWARLDDGSDDASNPAAAFSPIGRDVIEVLRERHGDQLGRTWDLGDDNALPSNWLIQTPRGELWDRPLTALAVATPCAGAPGCDPDFGLIACASQVDCTHGGTCTPVHATVTTPGGVPRSLCVGHADAMVDQVYDLLVTAEELVDVSSLEPPDGRFEAAVRNALTRLSLTGKAVRVRYLFGVIPGAGLAGQSPEPSEVVPRLVRDVAPGSPLQVTVAAYRATLESWDHAKLIVVDRRSAIVGGHNLMTRHYLQQAPAYDLSMQVTGSAARHATHYTDLLWRYACQPAVNLGSTIAVVTFPDASAPCEAVFGSAPGPTLASVRGPGKTRMIGVGRLGSIGDEAADDALVALVDAAQATLRILAAGHRRDRPRVARADGPLAGRGGDAWGRHRAGDLEPRRVPGRPDRRQRLVQQRPDAHRRRPGARTLRGGSSRGDPHRDGRHRAAVREVPRREPAARRRRHLAGRRQVRQSRQACRR